MAPAPSPPKAALKDELLARLRGELDTLERAHRATLEGATHPEAKPENDKDTRALEQSYLARGQAQRVEQLRAAVAAVASMPTTPAGDEARASVGALVVASERAESFAFYVCPEGGGERLAGGQVQVVTPRSPLGRALVGLEVDDDVEVVLAGRTRHLTIVSIA